MKILLLSDYPFFNGSNYYIPLAIPLINGYFSDNKEVEIKHLFIEEDGRIEDDVNLDNFDLIGFSCIVPNKIFLLFPHMAKYREKFYVGGPGIHAVKEDLDKMKINYFEEFGEWLIEDKLNIPRNPNIFSEQKLKLTDRLLNFFEYNKNNSNSNIILGLANGFGCPWNKCNFCHFNLSTIASFIYHKNFIFRSFENLKSIVLSLKDQLKNYKKVALMLTSFDMPPELLIQTSKVLEDTFPWFCFLRPRKYPVDLFKDLKKTGFIGANIGVEVAHDEGLKLINKGTTLAEIEWTLKELSKAKMPIIEIGYITHIPGFYKLDEAFNNFKKYIFPYIKSIDMNTLVIVKGSPFYEERLMQGQIPENNQMALNMDDGLMKLNDEYCNKIIKYAKKLNIII